MNPAAPTPRLSLHQLSLYNTGRMAPEQVIAAFAARGPQLERIVADLAAEKPKSRAQHHLIVGQRGMGKTMLLARIAAELRTDATLSARFIPLAFVEEQYAVDRLSKFWLNCLDSLADAREAAGDTEGVEEIDAAVERLTETGLRAAKDDQPFADEIYEAFARMAKGGGQRPVLLVDNLQLVFERLDNGQQHSLRELLMRPGGPIVIGASSSPPVQTVDYGAAFYDQFKVHYLRPLEEAEMRSLLLHLAEAAGRDDVRERVLQHPARLTVLRQLTGGNPRTMLTLFFLYAEDFAPSVFGDLEGLLDRVTPSYKARFEELTPQQQVVASAIANHWDPVTAAALVSNTGLPAGTISSQLDRLERTGVVERTELFGDTRTGYQLAERFFNIWFLMRSASRRQRREVEFLTRFLETFYEPADRSRLARGLMGEDRFTPDRYVWSHAVAKSLQEPEAAEELARHAELTALREGAMEARARLHELIDFDSLPPATLAFDDLRKKLMSLVPKGGEVTPEDFAKAVLGDRAMFLSGERERLATRSEKLSDAEIQSVLAATRQARAADEMSYSVQAVAWLSERLTSGQIRDLHNTEDWKRALLQCDEKEWIHLMVDSMPIGSSLIRDSSPAKTAATPESSSRLRRITARGDLLGTRTFTTDADELEVGGSIFADDEISERSGLDDDALRNALSAAFDANWGLAAKALAKAMSQQTDSFGPLNTEDWIHASAVMLHLNYGTELLHFLDERGETARLRPWVEALRALDRGERRALRNVAPEVRTSAEVFYDCIESRMNELPAHTRRRPVAKVQRARSRRR